MSRLTDLLRAAKQLDPQLGRDLEDEIQPLQKRLPFGLNFERHAPEAVELAGHKIRKGSKVRVLSPRGSTARGDQRLWRVDKIVDDAAEISLLDSSGGEPRTLPVDDLILVAEFRDWIYPGLRPDGTVERGGDKPFHTVINGENFHVLELLTFTHERAVDAIYIDPPYNTGARDWKYNNDYVEDDDLYRHSKWLAFMERRLKLAKKLLKPDNSVLIVTIDEKEYLRLGLLLEQTFPESRITMVTSSINGAGSTRSGTFNRAAEYLYFVQFGKSAPVPLALGSEWNPVGTNNKKRHPLESTHALRDPALPYHPPEPVLSRLRPRHDRRPGVPLGRRTFLWRRMAGTDCARRVRRRLARPQRRAGRTMADQPGRSPGSTWRRECQAREMERGTNHAVLPEARGTEEGPRRSLQGHWASR